MRRKWSTIIMAFMLLCTVAACSGGSSGGDSSTPPSPSSYAGYYAGYYDDGEIWMFTVDSDYDVAGTATSNSDTYTLSGSVDENGEATVVASDELSVQRLVFNIIISQGAATGTWQEYGVSGSGAALTISNVVQNFTSSNNNPLIIASSAPVAEVNEIYSYRPYALDLDGDVLTWSASGMPAWLSIDSTTGSISGTPTATGTFDITITVSDNRGGSNSQSFSIIVTDSSANEFTRLITGIVVQSSTGIMWQDDQMATRMTWSDGNAYCASLTLGGYLNWRLPTKAELESIIQYVSPNRYLHPEFVYTPVSFFGEYWTGEGSPMPYYVNFLTGVTGYTFENAELYVRCIR
jgi:hypothetical protein